MKMNICQRGRGSSSVCVCVGGGGGRGGEGGRGGSTDPSESAHVQYHCALWTRTSFLIFLELVIHIYSVHAKAISCLALCTIIHIYIV